jgi:outer membrane putative beta-barrel porin/alpha-amylase
MRRLSSAVVSLALLLVPSVARAQDQGGLSNLLLTFFTPARPFTLKFTGHQAHFSSATEARQTLDLLNRNIAYQLASFPLGSSSGGFTFTLDPSLGVLNRSAESFGPLFAERALTAGKGKLTVGANYVRSTWDRFEGQGLDNGDLVLTLTHQDTDNSGDTLTPFFEGDVIDARLRLNLTTDTTVVFANYGITDRFDVGVAVPFVRVKMDAVIHTTIVNLATQDQVALFHQFDPAQDTGCGGNHVSADALQNDFCANGSASGVGDIVVRGKLALTQRDNVSLAAGVDVRLPTGKEQDLLGTGTTQIKPYLIAGFLSKKKFSPHVNLGYTVTGTSDLLGSLPDEADWTVGFDAAPASRFTITGDVVGRSLIDAQRLNKRDRVFPYRLGSDPPRPFHREEIRPEFFAQNGTMNLVLGSAGFKVNPFGRLLLSFNALFPLSKNNGLQDNFTPVFAIDYNF